MNGNLALVKILVELGADVHAYDEQALRAAVIRGSLEITRYLVEHHNADIHIIHNLVLHYAAMCGYLDIMKYVVEYHNVNIHVDGDMPLRIAMVHGQLTIVRYLMEHRHVNITAVNDYSIHLASTFGHFETAWYLVCNGANEAYLSHKARQYGAIWQRNQERSRTRASTQIYFWWVQKCYQMTTPSGIRMAYRNLAEYESLCAS
jgi:hypothetical protein